MDRETPVVMASVSDQSLATQLRWLHESTAPFTNSPEVRLSKSWNLLAGPDSTRPLAGEIQKAAELEAEPPTRSSSVPQFLHEGGPADEVSSKSYNYNGQELDLPTQQQKSESEAQTSSGQTKTKLSSSCKDLPENLNGLENSLLRDDPRQDAGRFLLDDDMIIIEHEYLADVIRVAPQTSGKEIRRLHTIKEEGGDSGNERKPVQSTTSSSAQKSTRRRLRSQTSFNRLRLSRHPKQQAALKKPVVKATDISKTPRGRKVFRRVAQSILDDIDCNIINVNDFVDDDDDIGDGAYTDDEGEDDNDNRSGIAYGDYRNRNISILRTKAVSPPSIMELQRQMGGQGKLQKPPPIDPAARDSESSKKLAEDAFLRRVGSRILRHRRPPPAPQPGKLCLAKGVADLTHAEVKDGLEGQGKVKLSLLQFDPVYLRGLTPAEVCTCRWIFELTPDSDPDLLLGKGLRMRGSHVGVRYLDDQLRDEHHAYLMFFAFCNRLKSSRVQKKRKAVSRA
ncbi:uncharacterized protein LOC106013116 [Aplysia californica]|uniref:Uncharacterized protein LOC106013116 n=1 Tax=Aplysia californica TaxID=6500 RepID=A0ABM1A9L4_APLCA|nr:uncharacterized protein LOC106013116 [Aplysia californica]